MDELKKLARAWKLHERRNFWKTHTEKDVMVDALLQHLIETGRLLFHSYLLIPWLTYLFGSREGKR